VASTAAGGVNGGRWCQRWQVASTAAGGVNGAVPNIRHHKFRRHPGRHGMPDGQLLDRKRFMMQSNRWRKSPIVRFWTFEKWQRPPENASGRRISGPEKTRGPIFFFKRSEISLEIDFSYLGRFLKNGPWIFSAEIEPENGRDFQSEFAWKSWRKSW